MSNVDLSALASAVSVVAAEYEGAASARAARIAADAALLDAVIATVKPALKAISSRIAVASETHWHDGNTYAQEEKTYEGRGLLVLGGAPEREHGRDTRGQFSGTALYLLPDGMWRELTYSGEWSRWQGASSRWETESRTLSSADVASEYSEGAVDTIIERIGAAVAKAKGTREDATARMRARAERVSAVTALLKR